MDRDPFDFGESRLVGRESELKQLAQSLLETNRPFVVVHGPFGIGKTSLVRAVLERVSKRYSAIEWVSAADGVENLRPLHREPGLARRSKPRFGYGRLLVVDDAENLFGAAGGFVAELRRDYQGVIFITRDPVPQLPDATLTLELAPVPAVERLAIQLRARFAKQRQRIDLRLV